MKIKIMDKDELIQIFEKFLNENDLWVSFAEWLKEEENLSVKEIGFNDE
jgi:hypothetical protein